MVMVYCFVTVVCPLPSTHPDPAQPSDPGLCRLPGPSVGVVEEHWSLCKLPALEDFVFVKKRVRLVVKGKKVCCNKFSSGEVRLVYCYF